MSALSHALGPRTPALIEDTIGRVLARAARAHAEREALVVPHQRYRATYADLWTESTRAAKGLLALGVNAGDRVGIWAPNRYEWVVTQLATARVGAILVNVSPAYRAEELRYVLAQSGVRLLLLARGFRGADYGEILRETMPGCGKLRQALVLDEGWDWLIRSGDGVGDAALETREGSLRAGDAINIQYTSGTTGFPKGATLSHRNILNNAWLTGERLRYDERDRICVPVPFYHCFGMVLANLAALTRGACIVVPGEAFDPAITIRTASEERCTSLYGVPTMFVAILEQPIVAGLDLSSLRTGIMAGAPCPPDVLRRVRETLHMTEVTVGYGMTETSPLSTQTSPDDPPELQVTTVGTVLPHVEVKIVSPSSGATLARGEPGELCTRGYGVMLGYWNDPIATRAAIDSEGWMHSGDLASMDETGYVRIEGRIKDMIIRGGENISPREIEEFLRRHPAVEEAYVVGVPSARYGEEVMAWVKPRAGTPLAEADLVAHCRGKIAGYKIPRHWSVVEAFPMTVTGKVQKFRLREMADSYLSLRTPKG